MTPADDRSDLDVGQTVEPAIEPESESAPESAPAPGSESRRARLPMTIAIALVIVGLDQWTKHWALNALEGEPPQHVIGTLQWNLTFNSGMAFSRAQGIGPYIGAVAFIVIAVMLVSLRRSTGRTSAIAVGLVVGGAVGNLTDRMFREEGWLRGRVIDFIDVQWWPIWNIADMGVTIGGVLIVLTTILESRRATP